MSEDKEQLKPCQCGGKATLLNGTSREPGSLMSYYCVFCSFCGMSTGRRETKEEAVNVWNVRHNEYVLQAEIATLKGRISYLESVKDGYCNETMNLRQEVDRLKTENAELQKGLDTLADVSKRIITSKDEEIDRLKYCNEHGISKL